MERAKAAVLERCPEGLFMCQIIEAYTKVGCDVCNGMGHTSTNCTTLKQLNRSFSSLGMRFEWGKAKGAILAAGMAMRKHQNREVRAQLRAEAQNYLADYLRRQQQQQQQHQQPQANGAPQ